MVISTRQVAQRTPACRPRRNSSQFEKDTAAVELLERSTTPTTIRIIFASSAKGYHTAGEPNKRRRSGRRDHAAAAGKTSADAAATIRRRHGSSSQARHSII